MEITDCIISTDEDPSLWIKSFAIINFTWCFPKDSIVLYSPCKHTRNLDVSFILSDKCVYILVWFYCKLYYKENATSLEVYIFSTDGHFPATSSVCRCPRKFGPPKIWSPRAKFPRKYGPPGGIFPRKFGPPLQTWMLNNFVRVQCIVNVSVL